MPANRLRVNHHDFMALPYVRSLRKVSTFNQQISSKSAATRNKKPILNDIIYIFCNLKP